MLYPVLKFMISFNFIEDPFDGSIQRRLKAQELYMGPLLMFQSTSLSLDEWINLDQGGKKAFSMLKSGFKLPENIHLMTVENWLCFVSSR